jgi:hypothetical protein
MLCSLLYTNAEYLGLVDGEGGTECKVLLEDLSGHCLARKGKSLVDLYRGPKV